MTAFQGASSTAGHADSMGDRQSLRIRKATSRASMLTYHFIPGKSDIVLAGSLAKIFVFSIAVDGPVQTDKDVISNEGYVGGSRSLDSLDKLITSTESFFHPSNSGHWTVNVGVKCNTILVSSILTSFLS